MSNRQCRSLVLLAVILITATALASQTREDLPPAVSPDQWVALSDKAGIVIRGKPRPGDVAKGQLWVKVNGSWLATVLEQPQQVVPAR